MRRSLYAILVGVAMMVKNMETSYLDVGKYEKKVPHKKIVGAFYRGKTFYQNPNLKQNHYFNKTIPKGSKLSYVSLKGKEIKAKNKRKSIENRMNNK